MLAFMLALTAACKPDSPGETGDGVIAVGSAPTFDPIDIGTDAPAFRQLTVTNVGNGPLSVQAPSIESDGAFSMSGDAVVLAPDESAAYGVTFDPRTPFEHAATLVVKSDDPAAPETRVALEGLGVAPVLGVDTEALDLGALPVGCSARADVVVRNEGNEVLEVAPSVSGSAEIVLVDIGEANASIEPGDDLVLSVEYRPVDGSPDSASLTLESSDPIQPLVAVPVTASGETAESQTDRFEGFLLAADIVFVVDNSASMETEQAALSGSIASFVDTLDPTGIDYRVGVITTDTAGFVGEVVTTGTKDAVAILADQVASLGTDGSGTERALQMLYECVAPGSDCSESAGFLRTDALLDVIIVSDGSDQSVLEPAEYVEELFSLKTDPTLLEIDAVAGEVPGPVACSTCDTTGFGYDEAQELTDGLFLSICADWDENMIALAESVPTLGRWFALSQAPVEDTIEVYVDGALASGWFYVGFVDPNWPNVVVFDEKVVPREGATVEVSYSVAPICP